MLGARVVIVANMKPANMRGIKSHAMVLAASTLNGAQVPHSCNLNSLRESVSRYFRGSAGQVESNWDRVTSLGSPLAPVYCAFICSRQLKIVSARCIHRKFNVRPGS